MTSVDGSCSVSAIALRRRTSVSTAGVRSARGVGSLVLSE
jgi:hypothetical protein